MIIDPKSVEDEIDQWKFLADPDGAKYRLLERTWQFFGDRLFSFYEPVAASQPDEVAHFSDRLQSWLGCCSSEVIRQTLYGLVEHLFFVGPREFESLYASAFQKHIVPWIVETAKIPLVSKSYHSNVRREIRKTLFCPITDSMRINAFHHINNIAGRDLRPDLRTLLELGDDKKIEKFLVDEKIDRIVLLEDFVGTGSQVKKFIIRAALKFKRPVLFVPLLICPTGMALFKKLAAKYSVLYFSPVIHLPDSVFVKENKHIDEPEYFSYLRKTATDTRSTVIGPNPNARAKALSAFGYSGTGGLVITHTNTPNNTILLLHRPSKTWQPLFPRSKR